MTQITYAEEILEVGDGKIKVTLLFFGNCFGVFVFLNQFRIARTARSGRTVYGNHDRQRTLYSFYTTVDMTFHLDYTDLYDKRDYLNMVEWSVADVNGDLAQCGLSGSPTKVKAIQNIVFQAKESKTISGSDRDVEDLIVELLANHTIG